MKLLRRASRQVSRIRRILRRRRLIRELGSECVYLVTYPKSGTTWLTYFLALARMNRTGVSPEGLSMPEVLAWVPDINRAYFSGGSIPDVASRPLPPMVNVHAPYDPRFRRVIYLCRDPRDVLVSYFHHQRWKQGDVEPSIDEFVREATPWPCDWGEHVSGWLTGDPASLLLVRYEDLKRDPQEAFGRVLDFCGWHPHAAELDSLIEASSFRRMREHEPKSSIQDGRRFIRKGKSGGWREELGPDALHTIEIRYGELMRRLGYGLETVGDSSSRAREAP